MPLTRSEIMARVRSKDTRPEMRVRSLLHGLGYRYRLHARDLPGLPDLAFRSRRKVVFVHGCFWHHHDCPRGRRTPKSNVEYWEAKIAGNVERDRRAIETLNQAGWSAMVVWECELDDPGLAERLQAFLNGPRGPRSS